MIEMSRHDIDAEIRKAESALGNLGERERRFWNLIRVEPARWTQKQYPGAGDFWVVSLMDDKCLYFNHLEEGWGWGGFHIWGTVDEYHWQQDELETAVCATLSLLDNGDGSQTRG